MVYRNFIRLVGCLLLMVVVATAFHSSRKRIETTIDDVFKQAVEEDYLTDINVKKSECWVPATEISRFIK